MSASDDELLGNRCAAGVPLRPVHSVVHVFRLLALLARGLRLAGGDVHDLTGVNYDGHALSSPCLVTISHGRASYCRRNWSWDAQIVQRNSTVSGHHLTRTYVPENLGGSLFEKPGWLFSSRSPLWRMSPHGVLNPKLRLPTLASSFLLSLKYV